jgi:hypothetical protein
MIKLYSLLSPDQFMGNGNRLAYGGLDVRRPPNLCSAPPAA